MDLHVRKSEDRGRADHGWLRSWFTFSFADYYDPHFMGFSALRVINQDIIQAGQGFPTHGHADMEIITYVLEGALQHKDSLGTSSVILPGEVQRMSAGTGIRHSEFNPSATERTQLLQIWILPDRAGHAPGYEQKSFRDELASGALTLVASPTGRSGSVSLHQDTDIHAAKTAVAKEFLFSPRGENRGLWLQLISGGVDVAGQKLQPGDALAARASGKDLTISAKAGTEFLLFDLP